VHGELVTEIKREYGLGLKRGEVKIEEEPQVQRAVL
jgi:hypothetical protein